MGKNGAQIGGFSVVKKAPSPWKKFFLKKKYVQRICADKIFKTMCGNFFKINGSRDIEPWVILQFWKIVHLQKIINKSRLRKKEENSAHHFGDNYLTDHLVKFLQDSIKP